MEGGFYSSPEVALKDNVNRSGVQSGTLEHSCYTERKITLLEYILTQGQWQRKCSQSASDLDGMRIKLGKLADKEVWSRGIWIGHRRGMKCITVSIYQRESYILY